MTALLRHRADLSTSVIWALTDAALAGTGPANHNLLWLSQECVSHSEAPFLAFNMQHQLGMTDNVLHAFPPSRTHSRIEHI